MTLTAPKLRHPDLDVRDLMKRTTNFSALIREVAGLFKNGHFFYKESFQIVFVCGAAMNGEESQRNNFMSHYASGYGSTYFVLAENALLSVNGRRSFSHRNLADFENVLATLSQCILIFIESAGAIAEIGYFSKSKKIRKKILMVSSLDHQDPSFLNLGPMDLIERRSNFSPKFVFPKKLTVENFKTLIRKIDQMKTFSKVAKKLATGNWKLLAGNQQLAVLLKLVDLFRILTVEELKYIHKEIFGVTSWKYIDELIGVLESIDLIKCKEIDGESTLTIPNHTPLDLSLRKFDELSFKIRSADTLLNPNLVRIEP